jgi:hypothetical protein
MTHFQFGIISKNPGNYAATLEGGAQKDGESIF